jgi:hypothetical protein
VNPILDGLFTLTRKHLTKLERRVRDKNSRLFDTFVNYEYFLNNGFWLQNMLVNLSVLKVSENNYFKTRNLCCYSCKIIFLQWTT